VREVEHTEAEVVGDIAAARAEITSELREISRRLEALEQRIARL
jgi:hypothetical protein